MRKFLPSSILLFALAGGALSGMPMHSEKAGMMKCCDKAKSKERSASANAARLCCALNCSESTSTSSGFSANFSPSPVVVEDSIRSQIAGLLGNKRYVPIISPSYELPRDPRSFQPKYIQHHSFLI